VILTLPFLLCGAVFGVAMNNYLPKPIIVLLLIIVLIIVIRKTVTSYNKLKDKEAAEAMVLS
jgi:uncharacterized membrane protein YfcA